MNTYTINLLMDSAPVFSIECQSTSASRAEWYARRLIFEGDGQLKRGPCTGTPTLQVEAVGEEEG